MFARGGALQTPLSGHYFLYLICSGVSAVSVLMMAHRRLMEAGVAGAKNGETVHEHAAEEYNGRQEPAQIQGVWQFRRGVAPGFPNSGPISDQNCNSPISLNLVTLSGCSAQEVGGGEMVCLELIFWWDSATWSSKLNPTYLRRKLTIMKLSATNLKILSVTYIPIFRPVL